MSNVLPFRSKEQQRERTRKQLAEQIERVRQQGGQAIESLASWRRTIPRGDRERLARNMDAILEEYRIVPSRLDWRHDYQTAEEFRRDLHRMRLPESASPERRLIAAPVKWTRLLGYVTRFLESNGESVSLEFLADRLIRGTRFHPTKKEQTDDEKLLYLLALWANELSEKFGLLATYRKIARARSEYFRIFRCELHRSDRSPESEPALYSKLSDEFRIPSSEAEELFNKPFVDYSADDWSALYSWVPDVNHGRYQLSQSDIADWKKTYLGDGMLHFSDGGAPVLWWGEDIPYLPHWFLGYVDDEELNVMTNTSDYWVGELIRQQGTVDPISLGKEIDWDSGAAYLVLYPDAGMNRVVPWLYRLTAEWSDFSPVDQSYDLEGRKYFRPMGVNETTVSHTLLRRVEESMDELYHGWESTSRRLETHPYLAWMKQRVTNIDCEIKAALTRTGRIGPNED